MISVALLHTRRSPPPLLAVVDDDPAIRHALSFAFDTAGISVVAFADGEAALLAPDPLSWRCMVLDQRLPGISGLDLLDKLRALGVRAPAILITTYPSKAVVARACAVNVEIVEKPLLDNQLSRKVFAIMADAPG